MYKCGPIRWGIFLQPCRIFRKNAHGKFPTRVDENMFFWGKFFGIFIFGHFFCPFLKT
jgi:hypothetical protein